MALSDISSRRTRPAADPVAEPAPRWALRVGRPHAAARSQRAGSIERDSRPDALAQLDGRASARRARRGDGARSSSNARLSVHARARDRATSSATPGSPSRRCAEQRRAGRLPLRRWISSLPAARRAPRSTTACSTLPAATRLLADERGIPHAREDVAGTAYDFRAPRRDRRPRAGQLLHGPRARRGRASRASMLAAADEGAAHDALARRRLRYVMVYSGDTLAPAAAGAASRSSRCPARRTRSRAGMASSGSSRARSMWRAGVLSVELQRLAPGACRRRCAAAR